MPQMLNWLTPRDTYPLPPICWRWVFALAALAVFGTAAGCVETRVVGGTWERWREIGDKPADSGVAGRRGEAWAVELDRFEGPDRLTQAFNFSQQARAAGQIADVWFLDNGREVVVYAGRFARKKDPAAAEQLKAVRAVTINGQRPFRKAQLVTIERGRGTLDPHDLSQFSGYRTLVVATFDKNLGSNFRSVAEQHASELRSEHDHDVYFYHGPNQSLVTVGLFTQKDFVVVDGYDAYGPEIRELQLTFPHTKLNGDTIFNPEAGTPDNLEPSVISQVP